IKTVDHAQAGHGSPSAQRLRTCAVRGGLRGTWVGRSVTNRKRSRLNAGPLSAATARTPRAGPGRQDLPLADLTGCFVQSDRNAVQIAGPVLIRGPSEEVTNAVCTESYEDRARPYRLRDTLSGGRNAVGSGWRPWPRNASRRPSRVCR